jgi:hypothetical protein
VSKQGFIQLLAIAAAAWGLAPARADQAQEQLWQQTYDSRQKYFEDAVGPLPKDILKMLNMTGVWPGGGLYAIPAARLGAGLSVYTTFGFTNPDMPTTVRSVDPKVQMEAGRATRAQLQLEKKTPAPQRSGAAGYGYELIVIAPAGQEWPLNLLQWAARAELSQDVGLLNRVEKYDGLTVEALDLGAPQPLNVLIAKAQPPLPTGTQLPAGRMDILVATVITTEEMRWSMKNGRGALLHKLREGGVGQVSRVNRDSVAQ